MSFFDVLNIFLKAAQVYPLKNYNILIKAFSTNILEQFFYFQNNAQFTKEKCVFFLYLCI